MSTLLERTLRSLKSDYVTAAELTTMLPLNDNARYAQIKRALEKGHLISLKRGVYRRAGYLEKSKPHPFEAAHYLSWPSYVSLESALSYHGLIPEAIYTTTSVTTHRAKNITNGLGHFEFKRIPHYNFFIDVQRIENEENVFYMANPWKALCDYIYCYNKTWINLEPAIHFLRLDLDELPKLSSNLGKSLVGYYSNKRVADFLKGVLNEH